MELVHLAVTSTGTTGSATGSSISSSVVSGHVKAVYVTVPTGGTCTCTLAQQGGAGSENILALSSITSSAWYYPRKATCDVGGTAITYNAAQGVYEPYVVFDYLVFSITAATTAKTFKADVYVAG